MTSTSGPSPTSTSHFPPTPPPSPPQFRRRQKKKENDPFFDLDLSTAPAAGDSNNGTQDAKNSEQQESLITRILLTPLYMLSLLLSLLYITRQDTLRRSTPQTTSFLHPFTSPSEPVQNPRTSSWSHATATAKSRDEDREKVDESKRGKKWILHRKIRKMARLEIGDAIAMSGRVMLMLGVGVVGMIVGVVLGVRWVWQMWRAWR